MRSGQRVYWHGIFPRPERVGTVKRTGTLRHEVLWDGDDTVSLVAPDALGAASKYGKCCPYCKSLKEQGRTIQ